MKDFQICKDSGSIPPTYPLLKKNHLETHSSQPFQDEEVLKRARDKHWNHTHTHTHTHTGNKIIFKLIGLYLYISIYNYIYRHTGNKISIPGLLLYFVPLFVPVAFPTKLIMVLL